LPENGPRYAVEFGSRVALQLKPGTDIRQVLQGSPLNLSRTLTTNLYVLQAADAFAAMTEAHRLAARPDVSISSPVRRRQQTRKHGPYSAWPNDTYFNNQWNLENRGANGNSLGLDLNVREAWPVTRGTGSIVAVADDGVELTHPEFVGRASNDLHFYFDGMSGSTNAMPTDPDDNHSTVVAGLALAEGNNHRGLSGVAPQAQLASWKIFLGNNVTASDEQMMDMFQYRSNVVSVENHSWGKGETDPTQFPPTALESVGISNAITFGRGGRGVVMVRSAGNGRDSIINANDDGYANDSRVVCVASVRRDGRAASYSNPGACLLVAAPGGDDDAAIFSADRQGSSGWNPLGLGDDFTDPDYVFSTNVVGTSFAAPQISGLVALLLSANPNLSWRDVQLILILSARQFDLADPDLRTNGAGFRVSHNVGFGVPDAGQAVRLAQNWTNRPPPASVTYTDSNVQPIPDDALSVLITGPNVPAPLSSIHASPGSGLHPDTATASLPLVDVGAAGSAITSNLTGKAALIQRGGNDFSQKLQFAADAGAVFAVVYDNINGTERILMDTDFAPIPGVFISQNDGEALRGYLQTNSAVQAQLRLSPAVYSLSVTDSLVCEHVRLRVQSDHSRRGDLRITLLSPQGTRSVLQQVNTDDTPGPTDWTYCSTFHFGESSAGLWTVAIGDEQPLNSGSVQSVQLFIDGVAITDTDADGLDDNWEIARFGNLNQGPRDDPDGDGYNNAREQLMGTDPTVADVPFKLDLSPWNARLVRLSWPSVTNTNYEVLTGTNIAAPLTLTTNVAGRFPETEWFTAYTNLANQFFRVRTATP
jgi:subtilisin-like proprotein convertase family protein